MFLPLCPFPAVHVPKTEPHLLGHSLDEAIGIVRREQRGRRLPGLDPFRNVIRLGVGVADPNPGRFGHREEVVAFVHGVGRAV